LASSPPAACRLPPPALRACLACLPAWLRRRDAAHGGPGIPSASRIVRWHGRHGPRVVCRSRRPPWWRTRARG